MTVDSVQGSELPVPASEEAPPGDRQREAPTVSTSDPFEVFGSSSLREALSIAREQFPPMGPFDVQELSFLKAEENKQDSDRCVPRPGEVGRYALHLQGAGQQGPQWSTSP